MERTAGFLQKYPPGFTGMLAATAMIIALAAVILLNGTQYPLLAYAFMGIVAAAGGFGAYRQSKFRHAGIDRAPPLIKSTSLATLFSGIAFGVYFFIFSFLVRQPGENYRMTEHMTVFGVLMGAVMTYRRRRWPDSSMWHEAGSAAIVVASSVAIWLIIDRVFGL